MTKLLSLLGLHIVLLAFASTHFTVVTGLGHGHFQWEYFRYFVRWGSHYHFIYSLPVVLTFLAAYAIGVAAYSIVFRGGSRIIGLAGVLLCTLGFASFTFELSHWLVNHNWSWIASSPIALLVLAPAAAVQHYRRRAAELGKYQETEKPVGKWPSPE